MHVHACLLRRDQVQPQHAPHCDHAKQVLVLFHRLHTQHCFEVARSMHQHACQVSVPVCLDKQSTGWAQVSAEHCNGVVQRMVLRV